MVNHQKKLLLYQAKLLMLLYNYSKFLLFLSMFFLLSCNYQPLLNYEKKNKTLLNEGKFLIFSPNDEIDFSIREKLLSDFGFPKNPKYKLELGNSLEKKKSIVTENNDITRYNLILISLLTIKDLKTNKILFTKQFDTETAFSASNSMTGFKTEIAKSNAEKRLAFKIAEEIKMEILIIEKDLLL